MKKSFLLFPLLLLLISSCTHKPSFAWKDFPSVMAVATKLDNGYSLYSTTEYYYALAKKAEGWYLVKKDFIGGKIIASELYWSSKTKSYRVLPLSFWKNDTGKGSAQSMINSVNGTQYGYDHEIYFGYPGWENDVIHELEGAELSDTLLESLGRAYEQKSLDILRPDNDQDVDGKHPVLTDREAQEVSDWVNKEIEAYKKIEAHDPHYETLVGKIKTKIGNTYMYAWSELCTRGRPDDAKKFIVSGLYDPMMIDYAKNCLNSAGKNAIIFCNGDDDTYVLWYVQEESGMRKDVAVVNVSLLSIPDWMYYWKDKYGFELGMSQNFYRSKLSDIIYPNTSIQSNSYFRNQQTMRDIRDAWDSKDQTWFLDNNGETVFYLPHDQFRFTFAEADSSVIDLKLDLGIIYKGYFAMFDITASNYKERPVYYQSTIGTDVTHPVLEGLRGEGLLNHFDPDFYSTDEYAALHYNLAKFETNLDTYVYSAGDVNNIQASGLFANYFYQYSYLTELYLDRRDTVSAKKTFEACIHKLPLNNIHNPSVTFTMAIEAVRMGEKDKGEELIQNGIGDMKDWHRKDAHKDELEQNIAYVDYLTTFCDDHNMPQMEQKLKDESEALKALKK
ncbi:MAG: hypothetical protein HY064_16235 [Bacteroidetes bacterium]|nr:hypothetical protein [Bacteroidota bacterium]